MMGATLSAVSGRGKWSNNISPAVAKYHFSIAHASNAYQHGCNRTYRYFPKVYIPFRAAQHPMLQRTE
jgi:hypothetical protein